MSGPACANTYCWAFINFVVHLIEKKLFNELNSSVKKVIIVFLLIKSMSFIIS